MTQDQVGQPPPPPPGHPNQSVQAFSHSQQLLIPQLQQDQQSLTDSQHQQQQSYASSSNLYSQPPPTQQQQPQKENWSDYNWRNIFDAALVKAQQAVQLDELGEAVLAMQLYQQAANDLGRVIPMCGSEKKKQSMLTIQAIYLDRVQQLKTATKASEAPKKAPSSSTPQVQVQEDNHQHQYLLQYQAQDHYVPQEPYQLPQEQYHLAHDPYQQQQQPQQQPYHPPPPPPPPAALQSSEKEGGFKLFGKKKAKAQTDDNSQQPIQDANYNYAAYNDYNNLGNGGYISPPYSEPHKASGSPATLVTPVFMTQTQTPSPTPPISSNLPTIETPEQSTKSSRWRPFGKKKAKSFSAGETSSGPYRPPNDYEIPTPPLPMGAQQQHQHPYHQHQPHLVDPGDHADAYSQQQHADWFIGNDNGPMPVDEYEQQTQYYDEDEEEDVDPFYIADNRGRAQAFEGKDFGKQPSLKKAPSKDDSLKENRKKPTLNHNASSYSNEQSFTPTFGPSGGGTYSEEPVVYYRDPSAAITDEQMFTAPFDDGYDYEDNQQGQYNRQYQQQQQEQYSQQEAPFDPTALMQHQHNPYSQDPSLQPPRPVEAEAELEEKSKNKWFGKKNKKKDPSAETYEDVAKRMDEALFGGGSSSSRKKERNKDKNRDHKTGAAVESTTLSPSASQASELRMSSLPPPRKASLDHHPRQFSFDRGPSLDVAYRADGQQLHYADEPQAQQQQQYHTTTATPMEMASDEIYPAGPMLTQGPAIPNPLMPVTYAPKTTYEPKTTYTPASKKPVLQPEELISEPVQLPSALDLGANFQQQKSQHLHHQHQQQQQQYETAGSVHSQEDGPLMSPDSIKKSKSRPFNLFKSKKSSSKLSLEQDNSPLSPTFNTNEDSKSAHSDNTRKSSIQSADRKAVDSVAAAAGQFKGSSKKRESDEYVPYEYQEELEGPLMERVAVREDRDIIGFVLPVEEIIDYTAEGTDEAAALDNWDSWVNQLESFEKVLADKGLKKDKGKKGKKAKKAAMEDTATSASASAVTSPMTPTSPTSSFMANRSSVFSNSMSEHRPMSVSDESNRTSMYSTRSSAIFGAELMSVQQAKRRWWNPKRKEATSVYSVSDSLSVSEQDQEKYLSSLLQNYQETSLSSSSSSDQRLLQSQPDQHHRVTTEDVLAVMAAAEERENRERQKSLKALLDNDASGNNRGTTLSLPLPQVDSMTSSTVSTKEIPAVDSAEISAATVVSVGTKSTSAEGKETGEVEEGDAEQDDDDDVMIAPMPPKVTKAKVKSSKPKLLSISTPLAQILKIQNPEELWQYVQQAKTYATTRMNKGDKRSAAIALKRAQALEARWQEIMLELASSEEDEDELLDDDDDDEDDESEEEESEEEEQEAKAEQRSKAKTVSTAPLVVNTSSATKAAHAAAKEEQVKSSITPASTVKAKTVDAIAEEEGEGEDADEERRRMHLRKVTSRSDSAPDMFSKYKVNNKASAAGGSSKMMSTGETAETDGDDDDNDVDEDETEGVTKGKGKGEKSSSHRASRLGADASLEQMLETTDVEELKFYIQRMKTETVAKARSGSKFAALEGMKNVKVLQQRLVELEEGKDESEREEENEEKGEGGEQVEAAA
ncbi:hypothetical protein BGX29_010011 [Mortierella sp. GBA35]|nr:hypothetical protein BGX29_010011 [Mortierella sp. GBA35]